MLPADLYSPISIGALLPEIILMTFGCVVLLAAQASKSGVRRSVPWLTCGSIVVAIFATWFWPQLAASSSGSGLNCSYLATFVRTAGLVLGVVLTLVAWTQPRREERGEFFSMMLFSLAGLLLLAAADDLLMLFLALELVSIPTYVMVTLGRSNERAVEAGTKYFYLGAMAAAITAYGFSFLYGLAGSAWLPNVIHATQDALQAPHTFEFALASIGLVLSISGLLFKLAAVPLHFYIADVYQGAACSVAGFLGFVPKLAGVVALLRVVSMTNLWTGGDDAVYWLLWVIAVASMTIGNVLALMQNNVKRILAYSGIAHAGYMLVGIIAGPEAGSGFLGDGTAAVLYYIVIYGLANLAGFAVLGLLQTRGEACETLRDIAGLVRRHPGFALLMALAMFTLMGLPPTPGFWGKMGLFGSALVASQTLGSVHETSLIALVVIALLNSAVAAAYYLRVAAAVLLFDNDRPAEVMPREAQQMGTLLCGFLLLAFAFYPNALLRAGRDATTELRVGAGVVEQEAREADEVDAERARLAAEMKRVSQAPPEESESGS